MESKSPEKSRNVDFKEKLDELRKEREKSIHETDSVVTDTILLLTGSIKKFQELQMKLSQKQRSNLSLTIYWKKVGPNRVFPKGPYLQLKHRRIRSKKWDAYHLGPLIDFKPKELKDSLPEFVYLELNSETIDDLCSAVSILRQFIATKSDIERLIKELKLYLIPYVSSDTNEKLIDDIEYILETSSKYLRETLRKQIRLEEMLDAEVKAFNSIMKKRYKSLFFKWNIHPSKRKKSLGHGHLRPYIITSLTFNKQFSTTVESYKIKKQGTNLKITPWITNRVCIDARASQLKKAILNRQKKIINLTNQWDVYYHQIFAIHTFIFNIHNEVKQ